MRITWCDACGSKWDRPGHMPGQSCPDCGQPLVEAEVTVLVKCSFCDEYGEEDSMEVCDSVDEKGNNKLYCGQCPEPEE